MTTSDDSAREARHAHMRQTILDAAREIIQERGADNLSLREIARRIGYSPAGLYEYFDGKHTIIEALCAQARTRLRAHMDRTDPFAAPDQRLIEIGLAYIDFAVHHPEHFAFLYLHSEIHISESDLRRYLVEAPDDPFALIVRTVQDGINEALFKTHAGYGVLEIAFGFWALVHGAAVLRTHYMKEFPLDFARTDRENIRRFVRGLRQ